MRNSEKEEEKERRKELKEVKRKRGGQIWSGGGRGTEGGESLGERSERRKFRERK